MKHHRIALWLIGGLCLFSLLSTSGLRAQTLNDAMPQRQLSAEQQQVLDALLLQWQQQNQQTQEPPPPDLEPQAAQAEETLTPYISVVDASADVNAYSDIGDWTAQAAETSGPMHQRVKAMKAKWAAWPAEWDRIEANLEHGQSIGLWWSVALHIVVMLLVGFICERLLAWKLNYLDCQGECGGALSMGQKARWIFSRAGVQVLSLLAFLGGALICLFLQHEETNFLQKLQLQVLSYVVVIWVWHIVFTVIFSPRAPVLRLMQLPTDKARSWCSWYSWFLMYIALMEFGGHIIYSLLMLGLSSELGGAFSVAFSCVVMLTLYARLFQVARRGEAFFRNAHEEDENQPPLNAFWQRSSMLLLSLWLAVIWAMWARHVFLGNWDESKQVAVSFWITITFPMIDRLVYVGLSRFGRSRLFSGKAQRRGERFVSMAHTGVRMILLALAVYALSLAWGFGTDQMLGETIGMGPISAMIDVILILVMGYVVWELIQAAIDRHLPDIDGPGGAASLEGDGGGSGASRSETLMPLLRTVVLSVLALFITLSVLSSLGVQIGPLLAGAGVIGIAIGFGAQKLVQDILSGIFFLIDDAFRRGEYIEIEELRGTVEKISLRSMQLRHHLGAVQTIPYGEIKTVRNLSRDWVTMKLELRLPYDTDIEKVRKIVKKVGQKMLEDEEMGPSFLLPLKSQGVFRMEESALIVRVKFTTKPGEQWVVRREAYRRVKEALEAQNIHFAHREVRVRLPENLELAQAQALPAGASSGENALAMESMHLTKAAAAAATGVLAAEAARMERLDSPEAGDDR